jgi:indole-3-glycerol phosphate synthase
MTATVAGLLDRKVAWVEGRRKENAEGVYKAHALALPLPPSFHDAIRVPRADRAVIAQITVSDGRGDPSRVGQLVRELETAGVSALALKGDFEPFEEVYQHVLAAAQVTSLPVLCREAVLDPLQIVMARAHGAAAVTLEPSIHSDRDLRALYRLATELGLDVLLVVRSPSDMDAVQRLRRNALDGATGRLVGVTCNGETCRESDLNHFERIAVGLPEFVVAIAVADVASEQAALALESSGFECFMVSVGLHSTSVPEGLRSVAGSPRFA